MRLLEISHGTWEGRLREEIEREDPQRMQAWRTAPQSVQFEGGESLANVDVRWRSFIGALKAEDTIVVTHDVVVRVAILSSEGRPLSELWKPFVHNGGYAIFEHRPTEAEPSWKLVHECEDEHLHGILSDSSRQAL